MVLVSVVSVGWLAARLFRRLEVVGDSMRPTLEPGDRLVLRAGHRRLVPGDLVALPDPRRPSRIVVKRVAAVESGGMRVLGDNAGASTDSRLFGPVAPEQVLGRVVYRYHPPHRRGRLGLDPGRPPPPRTPACGGTLGRC